MMSSKESSKEALLGVRPFVWVIGIVWVIIISIISTWLNGFTFGTNWGFLHNWYEFDWAEQQLYSWVAWPFIVAFIASLIARPLKLTAQEVTVIITMVWISWFIPRFGGVSTTYLWVGALIGMGDPWKTHISTLGDCFPTQWLAPDPRDTAIWEPFFYGGVVPWSAWTIPIIFYILYSCAMYFTSIFAATLVRRIWIDVEALPYPASSAATLLVEMSVSKNSKRPELFRNKCLWLGMLVGFLTTPHYWMHCFIEQIPIIDMWRAMDITPLAIIPWVPLMFVFESWIIGAFYFVPQMVSLSFVLFNFILLWILPPIMTMMGILPPMPAGNDGIDVWYFLMRYNTDPVVQKNFYTYSYGVVYGFFIIGAMWACVIWPLIVNRRFVWENIKAIWKRMSREVEEREPIPYKVQWLILILLILFWDALMVIGSDGAIPFWFAPVWILQVILVNTLWGARFYGDFGGIVNPYQNATVSHLYYNVFGYWWAISPMSPAYVGPETNPQPRFNADVFYSFPMWGYSNQTVANCTIPGRLMESYRMADNTKTHSKYILAASLLAVFLAVTFSIISGVFFSNTYGVMAKWKQSGVFVWNGGWQGLCAILNARGEYKWQWWPGDVDPPATLWIAIAIGFITVVILYILRAKVQALSWLHPIGLAAVGVVYAPIFWSALIGAVAKFLTIRIGGTTLYEKKGVPFALGLCASFGVVVIFSAFVEAFRLLT